jgi:hypothetical protein
LTGTYITEDDTALLEDLGLIIVVNVEAREEDLVLVGGKCALYHGQFWTAKGQSSTSTHGQSLVCFFGVHATKLYKRPESCVVEIVDVT